MKQTLFLSLLLAIVVALSSCNKGGDQTAQNSSAGENAKIQQQAQQQQQTQQTHQQPHQQQAQQQQQVDPGQQAQTDKGIIEKYVAEKGLKGKFTPSGMYYVVEKEGKGKQPNEQSKVSVHYRGTLTDGTEFDSSYSRNAPAEFPLQRVIKGWTEGIPLLKEGGKAKLIIPSGLAYGPRAVGAKIPANSVLVFDVELLKVLD